MIKKVLRQQFLKKRTSLLPSERSKLDDLLLIQFQKLSLPFIQSLFTYWPLEKYAEPNVHLFTDYLDFMNPGLKTGYPRINVATGEMRVIAVTEETAFHKNRFGIYEPADGLEIPVGIIDMVIVPLLAYDENGYRVGFGKGYYDKFLAGTQRDCLKIGFSYFDPVKSISDKDEFDVPLNLCITPQTTYVF